MNTCNCICTCIFSFRIAHLSHYPLENSVVWVWMSFCPIFSLITVFFVIKFFSLLQVEWKTQVIIYLMEGCLSTCRVLITSLRFLSTFPLTLSLPSKTPSSFVCLYLWWLTNCLLDTSHMCGTERTSKTTLKVEKLLFLLYSNRKDWNIMLMYKECFYFHCWVSQNIPMYKCFHNTMHKAL